MPVMPARRVTGNDSRAGLSTGKDFHRCRRRDFDTGKEVWHATSDEASYSSPVAATLDGVRHVFFFTRDGLVSLDPRTGAVRFRKHWRSRLNAS